MRRPPFLDKAGFCTDSGRKVQSCLLRRDKGLLYAGVGGSPAPHESCVLTISGGLNVLHGRFSATLFPADGHRVALAE
ncbi:MAG: hypothetical protein M1318_08770 [Firmicutes bacterium]|nr:hypothetical protein [Bacillota bacterium]